MQLQVLSGGAAQGLVAALAPQFKAETGCDIAGTFGAVGAMRDKLLGRRGGGPADPDRGPDRGADAHGPCGGGLGRGHRRRAYRDCGARRAIPLPPVGDAAALRSALLGADAIYFPDPTLATAGIHFSKVLDALGIGRDVIMRLRPFPNGATAMRALAGAPSGSPIGCTQVTEILATPGVTLVGPLPKEFELATVYTAGVGTHATRPDQARRLAALLAGEASRAMRERAGFEALV